MHYSLHARLAIAISTWLLARVGLESTPVPRGSRTALFYRDRRGRFVKLASAGDPSVGEGASPSSAGPGETEWSPEQQSGGGYSFPRGVPHKVADLLHGMGVTQQMYEHAYVPLVLPDDIEDIEALERRLREWISANINHWVTDGRRSIGMVMRALMWTYAISFYKYQPPQKMVAWYMRHVAAGSRINYVPPREDIQATAVSPRSRFQRVADFGQDDGWLAATRAQPGELGSPTAPDQATRCLQRQSLEQQSGARAFCPPAELQYAHPASRETSVASSSDNPTVRPAGSPLGSIQSHLEQRAECPRSVPSGEIEVEPAAGWKPSLHAPDPPWFRPPPHPPPSPHGTLKTGT